MCKIINTMLVYVVIFMFLFLAENTEEKKFKLKLVTVAPCKLPPGKMHPDFPNGTSIKLRKVNRETTVIDSNITVPRKIGPLQLSYRTYQLEQNNAKNLLFKLEKVSCSNPVTFKIIRYLNVDINKDCYIVPGFYHFENLDLDKFAWFLTKSMTQPGKYAFEMEFGLPTGIVSCNFLVYDLLKIKN